MERARLDQILEAARGRRALCIGDVMLDRFVHGSVSRISPEAPVAVLRQARETAMPGGAGNVARNLVSLGLAAQLIGVIGRDAAGNELTASLQATRIDCAGLISAPNRPTTLKTRFIASGQQLLRVDAEEAGAIDTATEAALCAAISQAAATADLILISDYAKGAITARVLDAALTAARKHAIPIIADPKGQDFARYGAVDVIKPNASELAGALGLPAGSDTEIEAALRAARKAWPAKAIVVTRAARGMSFTAPGGTIAHQAGRAREVYDVSGAGDTSLAALALGFAGGATLAESVTLALAASGVAVGKAGTATVSREELADAMAETGGLTGTSHLPLADGLALAAVWREAGHSIGFTNGCFDILHPGHIKVLEEARARCGRLIVGLNSDASVRRLKGPTRPINDATARAQVLSALSAVDAVIVFDEDTPLKLIEALQPDVLVKGGDYTADKIVGADIVRARGGLVHIVPTLEGHSTTAAIARSAKK